MKQWKKIIIFSTILVLLIGTLIATSYFKNKNSSVPDVTPTPSIDPVISIVESNISKITVENSFGTLEFIPGIGKTDSGDETVVWALSSPKNILFSSSTIANYITSYAQITADSVVTTSTDNLSEYGLDKPVATVLINLKSGDKKKILYGNVTAGSYSQYVMVEGSGRICTTSTSNGEAALIKSLDLMDTAVLNGFTATEAKELQFNRKKDKVSFIAKSNNNASADGQTPATWTISSPITIEASSDGYTALLGQLVSITAQSFVELSPKDMAKYGLDTPSYDFTLIGESKKIHCILGGNAGNGLLYGYSDYIDAVFIVSTSALTSIDKPITEIINSFIYMASIWETTAIDIKIDDQTIHCDVKDDQEKASPSDFKVNGQDANVVDSGDDSYFRSFYQSLISVFIKGLDVTEKPSYQPSITISYTMTDITKNTSLGFVKRDDSTYYVFKNSVYQGFYVNKSDFYSETKGDEGILPALKILQNAMQNAVNGVYQ